MKQHVVHGVSNVFLVIHIYICVHSLSRSRFLSNFHILKSDIWGQLHFTTLLLIYFPKFLCKFFLKKYNKHLIKRQNISVVLKYKTNLLFYVEYQNTFFKLTSDLKYKKFSICVVTVPPHLQDHLHPGPAGEDGGGVPQVQQHQSLNHPLSSSSLLPI